MTSKVITAIEITNTHIKLIQSQQIPRGTIINKLFVREINSSATEDISRALSDVLTNSKIKTASVALVIPRQFLTLRVLRFPSQDDKELEKMVEFQLSKITPWPPEDIASDYSIVEKDSTGYSKVLLAICQKEIIKRYLKAFSTAALKIERITLSSEGICRWFQYFSTKNKLQDSLPVVLLDIDIENTDICFYHKENLLFTRSVSFGIADLKSAKLDNLLDELRKTFSTLQRDQIITETGKIFVTNTFEGVTILVDKLKSEFNCDASSINPLTEVPLDKDVIVPLALKEGKIAAASVLGMALGEIKKEYNLLPPEVKKEEERRSKIKDFVFLAVLLFLLVVFSSGALAIKIYKKERYLKGIEGVLNSEGPKAKSIEGLIKRLALVKDRLNPRGSIIDVISELYNIIPEGVSLSIFSFDDAEFITLQGISMNMSDVFNFQSILEKSPFFKNVEVKYASKRKVRQAEVTDFRITCSVDYQMIKGLK